MATVLGQAFEKSVRVTKDPVPKIQIAGYEIVGVRERENADFNIRQDMHLPGDTPSTPESLKKYRKSHVNEPGKIQKHWGHADDPSRFAENYSYGKPTYKSEHVMEVMKAQNLAGLADKFNDIKENQYASHQREPLGQGYTRSYEWPEQITAQGVQANSFGVPTSGLESAKEMLYPMDGAFIQDDPEVHTMYKKTHGNYAPGEQKERNYNWKVDPAEHCFGYAEKKILNGAASALHNERLEEDYPKTTIVKKTVEDHYAVANDMLGLSKNLGQGQTNRGDEFVHGIKNVQGNNPWNAARCIHGEPLSNEIIPDHDLGKSVKPNCRNVVRNEDDKYRSFGCPTVRTDIPFKEFKSVADYQNYGDEPEAVDLLYPANYSEHGVSEHQFRSLKTRGEIKALFGTIGYEYKIGKFNAMYNRAKEIAQSTDDRICVRDFQIAISEMHNIE